MARNSKTTAVKAAPVAENPTGATAPEKAVKSAPGGYAAWIGLDWADQKHDWSLCTAEGKRRQGQLKSTPEAIDLWAAALAQEFSDRPVAVALEQSRGSLTGMLCKYAHIVLIPVH